MIKKVVKDLSVLRQVSEPVESAEEAISITKELEKTLGSIDHGIGLAAVQIGIPKRVGVIKKGEGFIHLINPEMLEQDGEFVFFNEGCLSFPQTFRNTKRYKDLLIKNHRIEDGELKEQQEAFYYSPDTTEPGNDGLITISIQHEFEHFDGKVIMDHDIDVNLKQEPIKRTEAKIGRNDPCPCGSGKKYKKCCL